MYFEYLMATFGMFGQNRLNLQKRQSLCNHWTSVGLASSSICGSVIKLECKVISLLLLVKREPG